MKTIEIRGEIVSSLYDAEWFDDYISRGIITPESRFRSQLNAVTDDDVEVYINSPGGSCFAGFEMINAANDWRARTDKTLSVTIGSMAASMASAFAVLVGGKFRVHQNTKIMFHSAWGGTDGGPDAMRDEADLLDKINADIKTALATRYSLDPDTVAEWFEEGRMGWLNADEANAAGMVIDVVDADDTPLLFAPEDIKNLGAKGLSIAACLSALEPQKNESDKPMDKIHTKQELDVAYDEGLAAGKAESKIAEFEQATAELADAATKFAELSAKFDTATAELATLTGTFEAAKADHETALAELGTQHETALAASNSATAELQRRLNVLTPGMDGTDEDEPSENAAMAKALRNVTTGPRADFAAGLKFKK